MKYPVMLLIIGSGSMPLLAATASPETQLSPVTVTGNRMAQTDIRAPYASEIHSAADIEKSAAISLYDYLSRYSSVTVLPSYGNQYSQLIDMRGYGIGNGYQNVVVTVNGRRLNNVDMVPQLLGSIPVSAIERIEIIKGNGSVAQGDGAMSGIINIVTKDQSGAALNITGGSHGKSSGSVSATVTQELFSLQVLADNSRSNGYRDADINGLKDASDADNMSAALTLFPDQDSELRIGKERSWIDTVYGGSLTQDQFNDNPTQNGSKNYTGQTFETDINRFGATFRFNNALSLKADHFSEEKESVYASGFRSDYDYQSTDIAAHTQFGEWQVIIGAQWFDGKRTSSGSDTSKKNAAIYLQSLYTLNDTMISAGIRRETIDYTHQSSDSSEIRDDHRLNAWDIGINHQISDNVTLFSNLNQAFQAPDIDRFFSSDYSNFPIITVTFNGFIEPAISRNLTVGMNHISDKNKLKLSAFYSDLKDEIFYETTFTFGSNTNIDESHKYGIELQNTHQVTDALIARLNYNWIRAIIDKEDSGNGAYDGKELPGVSEHSLIAGIDYAITHTGSFTLNQTWRSRAWAANDFANAFSQKQKAYNTTDIGYAHRLDNLTLYVQVNNVFEHSNGLWIRDDAVYPVNFTRTWHAGIRAAF